MPVQFLSRELARLGFYVAGIHLLPDGPAKLRLCMQRLLENRQRDRSRGEALATLRTT